MFEVNKFGHSYNGHSYKATVGAITYYFNKSNLYHRIDGPAVERSDGTKEWYVSGKLHRTDGPAVERSDGTKEWWVNGLHLTEQEFNRLYPQTNTPDNKIECEVEALETSIVVTKLKYKGRVYVLQES